LQIVAGQIEKLGNQTNAALESISRGSSARVASPAATSVSTPAATPSTPSAFSDNYPKEGISYTVVRGDTLAKIAQKTGARSADIINANKISDPSKIQAGQVLFIPGGK
jgi:LysM repeat protein